MTPHSPRLPAMPHSSHPCWDFSGCPIICFDSQTCPPFFGPVGSVIAQITTCSWRDQAARASPAQQEPDSSAAHSVHTRGSRGTSAPEAKTCGSFTSGRKILHICVRLTLTRSRQLRLRFPHQLPHFSLQRVERKGVRGCSTQSRGCRGASQRSLCGPRPSQGDFGREAPGSSFTSRILFRGAAKSPINTPTP